MVSNFVPAIRFVLYSEDRADANRDFAVLREILRGMLKLLRTDLKMNHVHIAPVRPVAAGRICGSYWKVTAAAKDPGAQQLRRDLIAPSPPRFASGESSFSTSMPTQCGAGVRNVNTYATTGRVSAATWGPSSNRTTRSSRTSS